MEHPVVVGVDGSDGSLVALDWAAEEATRFGLPLRVVYASLWERYEGGVPSATGERPEEEVAAQHIVTSAGQRARQLAPGLEVNAVTVPDDAADALVKESDSADVVVTGCSGRGAVRELLLGSVTLAVAGRARCPVVVVRGEERNVKGHSRRVVVGVGEGEEATGAVRFAFREAAARGCELQVVRAWRDSRRPTDPLSVLDSAARAYAEEAAAALDEVLEEALTAHPGVAITRTVVEGSARRALLGPAADADLLVLGATRRREGFGLHLGRVSHTALHRAGCPVAVVPHR
ncbi:universal stress protein [Streptomyces sp. NPDC049577]|uniref:universal stress protein n=1 Tax=Streptomyces sp. NPDC049577 TaxID=3155153 RepID=UPI00342140A8